MSLKIMKKSWEFQKDFEKYNTNDIEKSWRIKISPKSLKNKHEKSQKTPRK